MDLGELATGDDIRREMTATEAEMLSDLQADELLDPKTVAKMEAELGRGPSDRPREPRSTVLSIEEEAVINWVRWSTLPRFAELIRRMDCRGVLIYN